MKWTLAYIATIALCNVGFVYVPLLTMPTGEKWPPMSLLVGLVFVARDFAQKEVGHRVWFAMLAGAALSYFMASPFVAIASAVAFLTSEAIDWAIYSFTRRPLHERILWSSLASTPIDSAVFLAIIGHLSVSGVLAMTASKMIAALVIAYTLKRRLAWQ